MKKTLATLLLAAASTLLTLPSLAAQSAPHLPGEILVRLDKGADLQQLAENWQSFRGQPTRLKVMEETVPYLRIWRLSFDESRIPERAFLRQIQRTRGVQNAQFNHLLENRSTLPNDEGLANQWQYVNEGQGGCTTGADIDADLAWDITTGGKNALGDDIVVCIVDDGLDPAHEDFGDNIWINEAEIPGNGEDDDNNGFVDDYAGWNTSSDSDAIDANNGHGTPVAGIVGAQGNNGIGVAGVNWDVKLMIVVGGSGIESEVLKAYSFPLAHRMRYNASGGQEGSFVVATNSSWGVNFGQPDEAPLWCAFYDTLGVHGILNAGATINGNQNVDEVGDLPTGCSSDFMISVTNLNCTGNKVSQAGYGLETIDLGAFGQGTYTTSEGNNYGGFGGTSGATPHVAGAIALLYAAPCPNLSQMAIEEPAEAALIVRQAIFDGTVPNVSLDTVTVTGGQLNLYNSLLALLDACGGCFPATQLEAETVSDSSAQLSWASPDSILQTDLLWRAAGDSTWMILSDTTSPARLSGLSLCREYEFRVEFFCSDSSSTVSTIKTFKTTGCCLPASSLSANASKDSVLLTWSTAAAADSQEVLLFCSTDTLQFSGITSSALTLEGLDSCQSCYFQVRSLCRDTSTNGLSEPYFFDIPGCGACVDLDYCSIQGSTNYEYIQRVQLNELDNLSGDDEGYGDYTGLSTELAAGATYSITITPTWVQDTFAEHYWVWIDYDKDGIFEDSTELALEILSLPAAADTAITIPNDVPLGGTRLRIAMAYEGTTRPACLAEIEGEVEDYCVSITEGQPNICFPLAEIITDSAGYQTLHLSWADQAEDTLYRLQYRKAGLTGWNMADNLLQPRFELDSLQVCTEYEFRVQRRCAAGWSDWSETFSGSTACNPPCNLWPSQLTADTSLEEGVQLTWLPSNQAKSYELEYRMADSTDWQTLSTTAASLMIDSLLDCTDYLTRVRAVCEGVENRSAPSPTLTFSTACLSSSQSRHARELKLQVQPNPFRSKLGIRFELPYAQPAVWSLYDATGRVMKEGRIAKATGMQRFDIQTATLPSGFYWLSLRTNHGIATVKVLKE
jgi:serine protease